MSSDWKGSDITKYKDQQIVNGYLKKRHHDLPNDIINLIFIFYHIIRKEKFKHYNSNNYKVSMDDKTLTKVSRADSVCYGSANIFSAQSGIFQWTFKILNMGYSTSIAIGIDEISHCRKQNGHFGNCHRGRTKAYVLWDNGSTNKWDNDRVMYAMTDSPRFIENDTVIMILDLDSHSLSYKINNKDEQIVFTDIITSYNINYCLAVSVYIGDILDHGCIELVDCERLTSYK